MTSPLAERADEAPTVSPVVFSHPDADSPEGQPVADRSGTPVHPLVFR